MFNEHLSLFIGKTDFHSIGWGNFEALQSRHTCCRLSFTVKFHECNVVSIWNQADFFEARKPTKKHSILDKIVDKNTVTCWLKSMESIMDVVSSGKFFRKRIWLALFEDGVSTKEKLSQQGYFAIIYV